MRSGEFILDDGPVVDAADGTVTVAGSESGPAAAHAFVEWLRGGASYRIARLDDGIGSEDLPPTPVQPDALFVLGDNRDASLDNHYAELGPVRAADLVGSDGAHVVASLRTNAHGGAVRASKRCASLPDGE